MNRSVWTIILNWNGLSDTIECVRSCLELDYSPNKIIIVDNGSGDGSETILRELFPEQEVIQTGANLGYAGGNNAGIRHALKKGADYIWLLNNDTVVHPHALSALVEQMEIDSSIGMVGSKILCFTEPSRLLYAGGHVDTGTGITEHLGYGCTDDGQFDHAGETGYITGCSLLIKHAVLEDIGFMSEAYFLYFEEAEWCVKAKNKGYKLIYAPESVVYHKESVSVRKIAGVMLYYMTRNRLYFIQLRGVKRQWMKRFGSDLINLLRHMRRSEWHRARFMLTAYRHWLSGYMGPLDRLTKGSQNIHSSRGRTN